MVCSKKTVCAMFAIVDQRETWHGQMEICERVFKQANQNRAFGTNHFKINLKTITQFSDSYESKIKTRSRFPG